MRPVAVALAAAIAAATALAGAQGANPADRPLTRSFGRATTQYQNAAVKLIASYTYSQRNHDTPWLLVHIGVSMPKRAVVHRNNFGIETWRGTRIPVASLEDTRADRPLLLQLLQKARAGYLQPIRSYFPESTEVDSLLLFTAVGDPLARDTAVIANSRGVVTGDLLFRSIGARWQSGEYSLVFDHEKARAKLPITLE